MKKGMLKKAVSLMLALVFAVALVPATANEVGATPYPGIMRQSDSPWDTYYYGGGSLADTGCGIFSLVNCVGYLTGELMDIPAVASWAHSTGAFNRYADGVYRLELYPLVEAKYGDEYGISVDCNTDNNGWWDTSYSSLLKQRLQEGYVALGHVPMHFIAIVGYDPATNKYHVYDSGPASHRGTNYNGGDVWVTEAALNYGWMELDWFCFLSARPKETWQEKAAFDTMVYRDRNPDLAGMSDEELKKHWLEHGIDEGRGSSPVLDLGFYLNNNEDLKALCGNDYRKAYEHFINHGYKEKRKSSALFDGQYYTEHYPEAEEKYGEDYMRHYVEHGILAGHRASLTFDPDYYWVLKPEVWEAWPAHYELCAKHYAGYGVREGVEAYDNKHPVISDVAISNVTSAGYEVTCKVTDNWGIEFVSFPTWTLLNEQDDLAADFLNTQRGAADGDTYSFYVKASEHNNELGFYVTHIYAQDLGGNLVSLPLDLIEVKDGDLEQIALKPTSQYKVDGTLLGNVKAGTTVKDLLAQFETADLKITDSFGNATNESSVVGTGAKVNLYNGNELVDSLTVVILGDVTGDGGVDGTDYLKIKSSILGGDALEGAFGSAADVDGNDVIEATDYIRVKSHFLGAYNLYA